MRTEKILILLRFRTNKDDSGNLFDGNHRHQLHNFIFDYEHIMLQCTLLSAKYTFFV